MPRPPAIEYAHSLLRRNWWQARDSDAVYAVAALDPRGRVEGGSAWAIRMLLDRRPEAPAFLFDQRRGRWLAWRRATGRREPVAAVPRPAGRWAEIGARALNSAGAVAIRALLAP